MPRSDAFDVVTKHAAEYFLCRQPSRFMPQRPTDKMVLPYDGARNNIAQDGQVRIAELAVGLTRSSMLLQFENLALAPSSITAEQDGSYNSAIVSLNDSTCCLQRLGANAAERNFPGPLGLS